jgi:hypothetical protein
VTAQNTMPYLDGVPVMNNFALSDDDVLVFDKPEGRVIDITTWCATNCPTDKVIDTFYMSTLNRLGWTMTAPRQFSNNQTLILSVTHLKIPLLSFFVQTVRENLSFKLEK